MSASDVKQAVHLIQKDLSLDHESLPESVASTDDLKNALVPVINYLLNKDLNRLLNALYRIDISEKKVKEVLTIAHPENMAPQLAELIVQREMQKVITRNKYRGHFL
ncbi:hypothetical protein C900_03746 [Fulvivirga imtechensis AK7]|uniref:Uncharacterized protein n=1 Tax=Fulvivirga imtechensis AK7 TaxID=1237149 RepID=L8JSQ4_9BACT|nr:hypothetical protein [Fulvivirga imtechensis]ELR70392.1 hypothetical protein C900_03746 [Fulvivirga imtechensis AK7]